MLKKKNDRLSKREQQIMDIIYKDGQCSANDIHQKMPDAPSYSAVRAMLKILVDKKHLKHKLDGNKYIYTPTINVDKAKKTALTDVLKTFFEGSAQNAVATLLDMSKDKMNNEDFEAMAKMIEKAKEEGK